jgi:hypothetical protein
VLDELLARVIHCCYGDGWATRIGGLSALSLLAKKCAPPAHLLQMHVSLKLLTLRMLIHGGIFELHELPERQLWQFKMVLWRYVICQGAEAQLPSRYMCMSAGYQWCSYVRACRCACEP